jgi:hypothetical protein
MSGMCILSVSKKGRSKRRLLWHFQKRKECTVYFAFFGGLLWSHNGVCFRGISNRIPRSILFEVYSGPIRSGLNKIITLSYNWRRWRASGCSILPPTPVIFRIGIGVTGGPWNSDSLHPPQRGGSPTVTDDAHSDWRRAGIRRLTAVTMGLRPPSRLFDASGPRPVAESYVVFMTCDPAE